MASKFFPVSLKIAGKKILVIGAGRMALRKVQKLLDYAADIHIITKEVLEEDFYQLLAEGKIHRLEERAFQEKDLEAVFLVLAATSDAKLNQEIAALCQERGILVNNISSKEEMNLRFASVYEGEDFQVAVSALGNPKRSKALREKIQAFLEEEVKKEKERMNYETNH